jgi:DNA repair protein RecN (Recombination protein N)
MIVELNVENIAIIEKSQVTLGPGFTVLTGETGAGKSLLVDAIELALGARAESELVRSGATKARATLTFDLTAHPELAGRCAELGAQTEDGLLFIQREVFAEGRSQCRINGKLAPATVVKQVGQLLVDLHGQHDHQSLLHPERHLGFLDAWIGKAAKGLLEQIARLHAKSKELEARLSAFRTGTREREQRVDLLRFQISEIEAAAPAPGEYDALKAELSRLQNAERLLQAAHGAMRAVSGFDGSARDQIAAAVRELEEAQRLDESMAPALEAFRTALYTLEDGAAELGRYVDGIEASPDRLQQVAERIDALNSLRRKYGDDESSVLSYLERAKRELDTLSADVSSEEELAAELEEADVSLWKLCNELSTLRQERARDFVALVQEQLADLAFERGRFDARFGEKSVDATGADAMEFLFSANQGEPVRPLSKIASGGELSRLMLAIKTVLADRADVPTLVFDEVDAGLGGRAASVVGKKLDELARHAQVLVISHLPQIAACATTHMAIEKIEAKGRTATRLRELRGDERAQEIARMLSGDLAADAALGHAKAMLAASGNA